MALALAGAACGEEEPEPPNKPEVLSALARCRDVEGQSKLDRVEVKVKDLDGVADLEPPVLVVESTRLAPTVTPLPDEPLVDAEGEAQECATPSEGCVAEFSWRRNTDSEQIFCGEDGKLLEVLFEVEDVAGFWQRVAFKTEPAN